MSRARDNANLGAQAGSGLDASDITTGVLPVGVTGGSGLTALGTVTVGNLSNTAIVYPAGHVLSCDSTQTSLSGSSLVTSGGASYSSDDLDSETDMSITVKNASSKILICYWSGGCSKDTSGRGFMYFRRQVDGATATTMGGFSDGDKGVGIIEANTPAFYTWGGFHVDTHGQSVGAVLKYFVRIYNNTTAAFYFCGDGASHGGYIMEIMQ